MNPGILHKLLGVVQLRRALKLVWVSARNWTLAGLGLMIIQALLPLFILYLVKLLIDAVAAGISSSESTVDLRQVFILILFACGATILSAICQALSNIIQEHQGQLVTDYVTDLIHSQSAAIDLSYYEDARYHDTFYRAQQEAPFRPTQIVKDLTQLIQNFISLIALAGLLFYLHWAVAIILFVTVLPGIIVKIRHADRMYAWHCQRTETERRAYDYHYMITDIFHAKELRLFDLSPVFRQRYIMLRDLLRGERLQLAKTRTKFDLIAQAGAIISLFTMLAYIAWQTIMGMITLGDMVMYHQAFQRAQLALQGILGGLAGLYEHNLFLTHFYGFLDLKPQVAIPKNPIVPPKPMKQGIVLENVTFRYPGSERDILCGINLNIHPGKVVALVGDNGAGKTTLAKLLCRLYDPLEGRIIMDGNDFRSFDIKALRREITMIFQDYMHYPLSARENIWIGDVSTDPTDVRVIDAARQSGADLFISRLPNGYETILGKRYEDGVEISIGEWQKVALSRAFLREAQLIILDEPTSAMSVRAEYEVFKSFRELLNGRSALLISHRFSTVRMADLICVLEEGKIVEQGSHEDLMKDGGRYAHLYEMQAQYYR